MKNESIFQYDEKLSNENFYHPEFVPIFTDEVDKEKLKEAKEKCGSHFSKACILDYLATGDLEFANISGQKEQDSKYDIEMMGKISKIIIMIFLGL